MRKILNKPVTQESVVKNTGEIVNSTYITIFKLNLSSCQMQVVQR